MFIKPSRDTRKALLKLAITGLCSIPSAHAEFDIGFFGGKAFIDNSDLVLKQGNTDLTYKDVSWEDRAFDSPPYYGARITYWFDEHPNFGLSIDYTHLKNYLVDSDQKPRVGKDNGVSVNSHGAINNGQQYYQGDCSESTPQDCSPLTEFNMSHGVNTITFNGHYRWFPTGKRDNSLLGRMQIYTGLGLGFSVPHVEARVYGDKTYEFQWGAGPAASGMLGLNYDVYKMISVFGEYKLTYVSVEDDLIGGGIIDAETVNHQLVFGIAAHFGL